MPLLTRVVRTGGDESNNQCGNVDSEHKLADCQVVLYTEILQPGIGFVAEFRIYVGVMRSVANGVVRVAADGTPVSQLTARFKLVAGEGAPNACRAGVVGCETGENNV